MGYLIFEYVPSVVVRLFKYLLHCTAFFRSPIIASVVKSVVYDNADDLNVVGRVLGSKCFKRFRQ